MNENKKFLPADRFSWGPARISGNPACRACPQGRQNFSRDHFPLTTKGTNSGIDSGKSGQEFLPGLLGRFLRLFLSPDPLKLPASLHIPLAASIAQKTIMPDLDEPIR
jgi:hypothetical protein